MRKHLQFRLRHFSEASRSFFEKHMRASMKFRLEFRDVSHLDSSSLHFKPTLFKTAHSLLISTGDNHKPQVFPLPKTEPKGTVTMNQPLKIGNKFVRSRKQRRNCFCCSLRLPFPPVLHLVLCCSFYIFIHFDFLFQPKEQREHKLKYLFHNSTLFRLHEIFLFSLVLMITGKMFSPQIY